MKASARVPFYDLFKLLVATIFLLLFLWIWIRPSQPPETTLPSAGTLATPLASLTLASPPTTFVPLTATTTPPQISTSQPTAPATTPSLPTESPVPEELPTPIVEIREEPEACEAVSASRLEVGMHAIILRRLNLRSSPGISNNWIFTNLPGTQVEIIGGPECKLYQYGGSYRWWQIKLPTGQTGWSAETSAFGAFYFMEPVP